MRTRLLNAMLLAALALAAGRLLSFLQEPPPTLPESGVVEPAAGSRAVVPADPGDEPAEAVAPSVPGDYDLIVARNLFSPTRGVVPPAPVSAAPVSRPQPAPKLTLFGVVILEDEKSAYLQEGTQQTKPRKVRENERFAGGTVSAIRADGVTFLYAGQEIAIPLRAPKDGLPALPAAVPTPIQPPSAQRRPGQSGMVPTPIPSPMSRAPALAPGSALPIAPVETGEDLEEYFQENPFEGEEFQEGTDETGE